jgi:hypothetical protein
MAEHVVEIPSNFDDQPLVWVHFVVAMHVQSTDGSLQATYKVMVTTLAAHDAVLGDVHDPKQICAQIRFANSEGYLAWCLTYA